MKRDSDLESKQNRRRPGRPPRVVKVEALPAPPVKQGTRVPGGKEFGSKLVLFGAEWIRELIVSGQLVVNENGEIHTRDWSR